MRLWHQLLIPKLPRQQLLGQWRECIALLGKGWGRKHSVVDYVFTHPKLWLHYYASLIANEMMHRGYKPNITKIIYMIVPMDYTIYPEHNDNYLKECTDNLKGKGIIIEMG